MDTKRLILFVVFSFSILMLWDSWQREHKPAPAPATVAQSSENTGVPQADLADPSLPAPTNNAPVDQNFRLQTGQRIAVETDLYKASIDTTGGDLRRLELREHKEDEDQTQNYLLMDDASKPMFYVAQTGFNNKNLPNHHAVYTSEASQYQLAPGANSLEVRLTWKDDSGIEVDKIYTFHRDSYAIDVSYQIRNNGSTELSPTVYYQIVHDNQSHQGSRMMPTFTGAAYYSEADKYKKLSFSDMAKSDLSKTTSDGWIGLVQHYFVSAWLPADGLSRKFYSSKLSDKIFAIGSLSNLGNVAPGKTLDVKARLYAGPQDQNELKSVAPGLDLTVDYGWLTIIASPLFWILSSIQKLVHNWGVAIILLTVLIKLAFYPLSAASYRSMANMRELAPRLQRLKEQYGDDRQKLHQAMMEMYKTEKINPMGGCLPILVQIPVFISLYWVLLGSVEMRHAPFMLWIQDLSAVDPYYVLPILMGATMIIQTKLNPKPADPIQAKVMTIMPIVFSVFFFFFPAGLVLYWLVNNILSIAQQWHINRSTEKAAASKKKGNARR